MPEQQTALTSPATEYGLRENNRYITGLDVQGNSIVLASPGLKFHDRGGYAITRLYQDEKIPADIQDDRDFRYYWSREGYGSSIHTDGTSKPFQLVNPGGANFVQGDMGPSSYSVWHRTVSVDFVTVVEGELVLMLGESDENCTKVHLKQGDSVVQRGTLHKWVNPSDEKPTRWVATLLGCEPFQVGTHPAEAMWVAKA